MKTKRRSHKNTPRLTAKERATDFMRSVGLSTEMYPGDLFRLSKMLADHARETLARYKRRQAKRGGA